MKIAVASGKGGTGKTTIATNIAKLLSSKTNPVYYVDCDVEEPNGHLFLKPEIEKEWQATVAHPKVDEKLCDGCGKCKEICQFNAITVIVENVIFFPELCHACGGCTLVCPTEAISEAPHAVGSIMIGHADGLGFIGGKLNIGEPSAVPLISQVKNAIPDDTNVFIDAPPGAACPMIETIRSSDYLLLVTEPTPFGLNDLIIAIETCRKLKIPFGVVINRAGMGDDRVKDYCHQENISLIVEIPDDKRIAIAYSKGQLIYDVLPEYRLHFDKIIQYLVKGNFLTL